MYFISEVLSDSKTCYSQIQKLLYAVLISKRKLRHYFESHPMTVMTLFPSARSSKARMPQEEPQSEHSS